jgi:hypothetical protein
MLRSPLEHGRSQTKRAFSRVLPRSCEKFHSRPCKKNLGRGGTAEMGGSLHHRGSHSPPRLFRSIIQALHPTRLRLRRLDSMKTIHLREFGQNFTPGRHAPVFESDKRNPYARIPRCNPIAEQIRKTLPLCFSRFRCRGRNLLQCQKNGHICFRVYHAHLHWWCPQPPQHHDRHKS